MINVTALQLRMCVSRVLRGCTLNIWIIYEHVWYGAWLAFMIFCVGLCMMDLAKTVYGYLELTNEPLIYHDVIWQKKKKNITLNWYKAIHFL